MQLTQWIARCAAEVLQSERPDLTLVYLPHLDYDPQRFGPDGCDMGKLVKELTVERGSRQCGFRESSSNDENVHRLRTFFPRTG